MNQKLLDRLECIPGGITKSYALFVTVLPTLSLEKNSDLKLHLSDLHLAMLYFKPFTHANSKSFRSLFRPHISFICTKNK